MHAYCKIISERGKELKTYMKILVIYLIISIACGLIGNFYVVKAATEKEIVLVIDPGHGGKMSGTVNTEFGITEREVTLKIARYLRDYLNEYEGIKVIMTHDGLPSDYELELPARGMIARNNNADMMISLHINDSSSLKEQGAEVFVTANNLLPKYNKESTEFGKLVLKELSKLGIENRGVKTRLCGDVGPKWEYSDGSVADYYAVIRYPMKGDGEDRGVDLAKGEGIPGILIEHCFMKGNDAKYIDSEEDIQKLARADCNALVEYYGLEKKDPKRVSSITLNHESLNFINGQKEKLVTTVKPDTAVNKKIIWSSDNEKVVTVSQTGEVTAVGVGQATITAKTEDRGKIATCKIEVNKVNITASKKEINLLEGKKAVIDYQVTPNYITDKTVTWKSSDESIVEVTNTGVITAKKEGNATITLTTKLENSTAEVKVNIHKLEENQEVNLGTLKETNNYLSKIGDKVTVSDFKKKIKLSSDLDIIVKDKKANIMNQNSYITTNTQVQIIEKNSKNILQEYDCLIYADVNEDGEITASDYVLIKNHIMEVKELEDPNQIEVCDVNSDKMITAGDYVLIKNHIMDLKKLELK